MLDNTINNKGLNATPDDEIDIKRLFFILLRKWYWLAIGLLIGAAGAVLYVKCVPEKFQADTSLLVTNSDKGLSVQNMFMEQMTGTAASAPLQNEIEFLRSFTLNHQAIDNLNWQSFWQQKNILTWQGIYQSEPFLINKNEQALNPAGLFVQVKPLSPTTARLEADGEVLIDGETTEIAFEQEITYGTNFSNEYFSFSLNPTVDFSELEGNEYRFLFVDKNKLTTEYLKKLSAEFGKDSEVIKLSLEGTEPLRDIDYLNELVRVYLEMKLKLQTETQKRSLQFIDKQLLSITSDLNHAESTYTDFRAQNQIIDLSSQGALIMQQLKEIEQEKSQLQMQLEYFKNLQSYLGTARAADQLVAPSVVGITDASLNALVVKLSELYSRRQVIAYSARENNPTLIILNQEIEQVTEQLREILVNLVKNTEVSVESLNRRYNTINRQLNNMPEQEQQLINIQRQYNLTSEIYTFLLQRRAELEISLASAVVDIHIIDPAQPERLVPLNKSKALILLIGLFIGLLIPAALILLIDLLNNSIHLQEDVEKLTSIAILGNVFHSKDKTDLVVVENPTAPITESYRTLRTNLQYKFTAPGPKVIGLHSIQPGEGKTFTSVNLACILAMNEKKTVIIGADLRKTRLNHIFKIHSRSGLSTYLAGQSSSKDIIHASHIDHLSVIPAGTVPPNPAELLDRPAFKTLIDELKKQFEYIIIDNAPVSRVTDGIITSKLADLNLFVLRYGVSKKGELAFINELVDNDNISHAALVINDIKLSRIANGYSYSYKYAYGKGY